MGPHLSEGVLTLPVEFDCGEKQKSWKENAFCSRILSDLGEVFFSLEMFLESINRGLFSCRYAQVGAYLTVGVSLALK